MSFIDVYLKIGEEINKLPEKLMAHGRKKMGTYLEVLCPWCDWHIRFPTIVSDRRVEVPKKGFVRFERYCRHCKTMVLFLAEYVDREVVIRAKACPMYRMRERPRQEFLPIGDKIPKQRPPAK